MSNLVIVESPSKGKTIGKYLPNGHKVLASYGHVRDLPSKNGSVDPEQDFKMIYELNADSTKHVDAIVKAAKEANKIYLASDPDREGEAIAWHIIEALKEKRVDLKTKEIYRVSFTEITKKAIQNAFAHPRSVDMNLVDAQQARRAMDYLVGFNLSPILWRKLPGSRSAGRVQSVALRLICEREKEIEQFTSAEYWKITGTFENAKREKISSYLYSINSEKLEKFSINQASQAQEIVSAMLKQNYVIGEIKQKKVTRNPYPPFITSTLQQEASRKLGFSTKKTMMVAQKLYEGIALQGETVGLITYMRTDGVVIAAEALEQIRGHISNNLGAKYLSPFIREYKSKAKNAQEAHEAIRPTQIDFTPDALKLYLKEDELKLYTLIWKRTIASQMASVEMNQTSVDIESVDKQYLLRATGSQIMFEGFYKIYKEDQDASNEDSEKDEDKLLPILQSGDKLNTLSIDPSQHFTEAPPRYSEASLVKKLEELGIGRPSTYASIISVLQDRNYVKHEKKKFYCEDRGRLVNSFLENFFSKYVEYNFTADLENQLDKVSSGEMQWKDLLKQFWHDFHDKTKEIGEKQSSEILDVINRDLQEHFFGNNENATRCPECSSGHLSIKSGRYGIFVGCSNYPECKYTKQIEEMMHHEENEQTQSTQDVWKLEGTQQNITMKKGPYGYYVETVIDGETKRTSIPNFINRDSMSSEIANLLISLPRKIGEYQENEVKIGIGKFGPYILYKGKFHSLPSQMESLQIELDLAIEHIKNAQSKELILGSFENKEVKILKGKYGPYIKFDGKNFAIPKKLQDEITIAQAIEIIMHKN
jgi:DNA topoisomerase-1